MGRPPKKRETPKSDYYRHPEFGHVYGKKIVTPVGRLSWPSLVTPKDPMQPGGTPRFECTLLLDSKDSKVKKFFKNLEEMAEDMLPTFNGETEESKKKRKTVTFDIDDLTLCKTDDEFDLEKYPYYKEQLVLVARNQERPKLISLDKTERGDYVELEPSKFLAGMLVRFVITPIITIHGISYKMSDVQLVRDDGVRFGGGGIQDSSGLLAQSEAELLDEYLDDSDDDDISIDKAIGLL